MLERRLESSRARRRYGPAERLRSLLLGRSSLATTEVYTHVFDEDLQRKQEGLEQLVL